MNKIIRQLVLLVALFALLMIFLQASSIYLFYSYYLKDGLDAHYLDLSFQYKKTFIGALEVIVPHLASQGIIVFILSHLLVLYKEKTKIHDVLAISLILTCAVNIFSIFLIQLTGIVEIKVITFVLFQLVLFMSLLEIFKSFVFKSFISSKKRPI